MEQFPYYKVFVDSRLRLQIIWYTNAELHGFKTLERVGGTLIDFCELGLGDYEHALHELDGTPLDMEHYDELRNRVFDIAELLDGRHDYLYFFMVGALNNIFKQPIYVEGDYNEQRLAQVQSCVNLLGDLLTLQDILKGALHFCLDSDNLSLHSAAERTVGFFFKYPNLSKFTLKTGFSMMPERNGLLDFERVRDMNRKELDTPAILRGIHSDKGKNAVSLLPFYIIENYDEMLYFEFLELLRRGMQVKRCKLCGRYFVLTDKRKREYCTRVYDEKGRTCQECGGKITYNKDKGVDDTLRQYETEYNKVYSRFYRADGKYPEEMSGKDITSEQFRAWSRAAAAARRDYRANRISAEDLMRIVRTV